MLRSLRMPALLLLALPFAPLAAQNAPNRSGFWISGGLGSGSLGSDCKSCSDERRSALSGYLALGGTLSPHVLLGASLHGYTRSEDGIDGNVGFGMVAATIYPMATGGFFVKGGVGGMTIKIDNGEDELTAKAPSLLVGVGYDFRVAPNLLISPYFNALASSEVSIRLNGVALPTPEKIKANLVQFGVALTIP